MARLKHITNTQKHIEDKVNYFIDCVNDFLDHAGLYQAYEIENPVSLVEKIIYQRENNNKPHASYYDNYLLSEWFDYSDLYKGYSSYPSLKEFINKYRSDLKKKAKQRMNHINNPEFLDLLLAFREDLKSQMLKDAVDNLISVLRCKHELYDQKHNETIKLYVRVLVSEYFNTGRNKRQIREVINNVFSREISKFPFPETVKTKKDKKTLFNRGSLNDQLRGFYNAFFKSPYRALIYMRIYGGNLPDDYLLKYNKVTFVSPKHPLLNNLIKLTAEKDLVDFFNARNCFIGILKLDFFSRDSICERATEILREEVSYISAKLNRDFIVDNTDNFIETDLRGRFLGFRIGGPSINRPIREYDLKAINKSVYKALARSNSPAKRWLLSFEPLFTNALKTRNVADYWHYLESVMSDSS